MVRTRKRKHAMTQYSVEALCPSKEFIAQNAHGLAERFKRAQKRGGITPSWHSCSLTLIGMPGSGKSSISKGLAKRLCSGFLDCDELIETSMNKRLCELIELYGSETFLDIESYICSAVREQRIVIAPGGSVVYRDEAMRQFKSLGPCLYLRISYDDLCMRLGDLKQRGVVLPEGYSLRDLYNERCALYEHWADITVDTGDQAFEKTLREVYTAYEQYCDSVTS